jgi:1,2-diacylglycerol 3-beta-galactosyltransferase
MTARKPHLLFLMSDTGGGHRAAARAIEAALQQRHPDAFSTELVDMWRDCTPYPFNQMPTLYTRWVNTHAWSYEAQFWLNDRLFRNPTISRLYAAQSFARIRHLYSNHPADVIVCVHSVFVRPAVYALRRLGLRQPFITVITDYALPTVLWYDPQVDRCLVPVAPAYERGLQLGLTPGQLVQTGAVIHPRFVTVTLTKAEARAQLGWHPTARIAVLVGGGDGMGAVTATAHHIDASAMQGELVIICGRNAQLKAQLERVAWRHPVRMYGFVDNMEVILRAADVLITKAGPATITEAAAVGVPMILNGAIRHQESPNADYVVAQGAGLYEIDPARVAAALTEVMNDEVRLAALAAGVRKLAQPDAIWNIADEIWRFCERLP